MVAWTDRLLRSRSQAALNSRILDVGAGNGTLLLGLHALGYRHCPIFHIFARVFNQVKSLQGLHLMDLQ